MRVGYRWSLGDIASAGGLAAAAMLLARLAQMAVEHDAEPKWSEEAFSSHVVMLPRLGATRGDTLPNVLFKAGDQEARLGEYKTLSLTVPEGSTETSAPLWAVSTGTDARWVQSHPRARFELAVSAPRASYRFDGQRLVFTGLKPGRYEARMGLWLRQGERRFTSPEAFAKGSGNCEAYAKSLCVAAISAPRPLAGGPGWSSALAPGALAGLAAFANASLFWPIGWVALMWWWRVSGRRHARRALSVFGPSATRWLGPAPAAKSPSYPKVK